jgi:flagellar motor switch/type III secretory pathway protein FliN
VNERDMTASGDSNEVQLWEPQQALRRMRPGDVQLSRGFLRCRPEKWFPAFPTHWLPVLHALGVEAKMSEIRPVLAKPPVGEVAYVGTVAGESMVIAMERSDADALSDELVPGAGPKAANIVLEYFMRRFVGSLGLSWSGPEATTVTFSPQVDVSMVPLEGSIRISCTVNTVPITVWIGLGTGMVGTLDGLWRRQIQLLSKVLGGSVAVRLEIAQLGVPPQMLSEYLIKGTVIDLEVKAAESITLKVGDKPWMPARLLDVGGKLGCEMTPGALTVPQIAEGATQLSVEFGSLQLDGAELAELSQAGAVLTTTIPVSGMVNLVINQEKVAEARLCVYEGRFAVEVQ